MLSRRLAASLAALALLATTGCAAHPSSLPAVPPGPESAASSGLGTDDGYVGYGETLSLTDDVPAIANLDLSLRAALDAAASEAAARGVVLTFTDAWRSERYQQQLFDDAVLRYGSEAEARRWVKPPSESAHVVGRAVDIATADAMDWLTRFGAAYGLCQIYTNESWHYEYVEGVTEECPPQLPDSSGPAARHAGTGDPGTS